MMNFNERANTLLYKNMYLSHFIHERVDVSVVCERWVETRTGCYIDPIFLLTIARCVIFRILAGVAQPGVVEGHSL